MEGKPGRKQSENETEKHKNLSFPYTEDWRDSLYEASIYAQNH